MKVFIHFIKSCYKRIIYSVYYIHSLILIHSFIFIHSTLYKKPSAATYSSIQMKNHSI